MEKTEIKFYVLGCEDNKILTHCQEKFYLVLSGYIDALIKKNVLSKTFAMSSLAQKEFILHPDNSSVIIFLHKHIILKKEALTEILKGFIDFIEYEFQNFICKDFSTLSMCDGRMIGTTSIRLSPLDRNPFYTGSTHPGHQKDNVGPGWGDRSPEEWLKVFTAAFELLKKVDIGFFSELNYIIKKIVPIGTSLGVHNSFSMKQSVGKLYLGYTTDSDFPELNILEAIIHESSHNKLHLMMEFDPIILNDNEEIYYSPYRPDARGIHGIYLGIHAFAPVIFVMMKALLEGSITYSQYWKDKISVYHLKNKISLKVLEKYGKFTTLGDEIFQEIKYVMSLTDTLFKELKLSPGEISNHQTFLRDHFYQVNRSAPYIKY